MLSHVGFCCVVMDDRAEFTKPELFPGAEEVIYGDLRSIGNYLTIGNEDYVCVMTRGHACDTVVQAQVLRCRPTYCGVIGSAMKAAGVRRTLKEIGISHLAERCFHRLSGGEQQLVLEQARNLAGEGYTVIQTTHHPEQSYMFSDRILAIQDGRILTEGKPADVLTAQTMRDLYHVDVVSLYDDHARICIPTVFAR